MLATFWVQLEKPFSNICGDCSAERRIKPNDVTLPISFSIYIKRQTNSGKRVGAQSQKRANRDIKFLKSRNTWSRLNMFKATEVEKKIRETNLLIDMQVNLSS